MVDSTSSIVNNGFPINIGNESRNRGLLLHQLRVTEYRNILKKGSRIPTHINLFLQKVHVSGRNLLNNINNSEKLEPFYLDAKQLIKTIEIEVTTAAHKVAKRKNGTITPQLVEDEIFGGIVEFEVPITAEIGGQQINGRIDDLIWIDQQTFKIREFKSGILSSDHDPVADESPQHRDFMQALLYAHIAEQMGKGHCVDISLVFYPNVVKGPYPMTDTMRKNAMEFVETYGDPGKNVNEVFQGATESDLLSSSLTSPNQSEEFVAPPVSLESASIHETNPPEVPTVSLSPHESDGDGNSLGWLDTSKDRPFKLLLGGDNQMEGYLHPKRAAELDKGILCAVEKENGNRIVGEIMEIKSFKQSVSGETASHSEEVFRIRINPLREFTPIGHDTPKPQTIIKGKITHVTKEEYYTVKRLPFSGQPFGEVMDATDHSNHYLIDRALFFQSAFIGGVQGTGKTTMLRLLSLLNVQGSYAPAVVILDAEDEFTNLQAISSTVKSRTALDALGILPLPKHQFNVIKADPKQGYCLSMQMIDPLDLMVFLPELEPKTYSQLQRIITDIKEMYPSRTFTMGELRTAIQQYMNDPSHPIHSSHRDAITRALQAISLDIFDVPYRPILDVALLMVPGKITVVNVFDLRDDEQRLVALYLLAMLHQVAMKRGHIEDLRYTGVLFLLDEVQRILQPNVADSTYKRRIISFLSAIHHRGRKRKYGIIYATQSPEDIDKDIIDLCNIKAFFQLNGSVEYLKQYLSKDQLNQLRQLPVGVAYLLCKGLHDPVKVQFPPLT